MVQVEDVGGIREQEQNSGGVNCVELYPYFVILQVIIKSIIK